MNINRNQSTKFQAFQRICSGFAFACLILFGALQIKAVEVGFGPLFVGARIVVLSIGFVSFLFSGMVGVSTFYKEKSKFRNASIKIIDALFADDKRDGNEQVENQDA